VHDCFNARQFDEIDDLFTPDFFSHPLSTTGFGAARDIWRRLVAEYPSYRVVDEDVIVDHDKVAVRCSLEGLPDSDVQPMLIEIFRVENGRIAEAWGLGQGAPVHVIDTVDVTSAASGESSR
jgi:hypothetical protein